MSAKLPEDVAAHRAWLLDWVRIPELGAIVDLGCGNGTDLVTVANRFGDPGHRFLGLDRSIESISAARVLGQTFKVSLHESGKCHVAGGGTGSMHQPGSRPRSVETWKINPNDQVIQPFGIIVPEAELREGDWAQHRDKGTRWIPVHNGLSVEIAIFLTRVHPPPRGELAAAGWHTIIVCERLPDGRDFWVIAGDGGEIPATCRIELQNMKDVCRRALTSLSLLPTNPRILALATDDLGTRRYVDAAVN